MYYSKKKYALRSITISLNKHKKYEATLMNKTTGDLKYINFGDTRYQHYKDKLKIYKHLNHNDKKRREKFRKRFKPLIRPGFYSAAQMSKDYLW